MRITNRRLVLTEGSESVAPYGLLAQAIAQDGINEAALIAQIMSPSKVNSFIYSCVIGDAIQLENLI